MDYIPVNKQYDGSLNTFYVPFLEKLWTIIYDAPTISYDAPTISYDAPSTSIASGWDNWHTKSFRLEILGDWTQGWETIGLDNVEIV